MLLCGLTNLTNRSSRVTEVDQRLLSIKITKLHRKDCQDPWARFPTSRLRAKELPSILQLAMSNWNFTTRPVLPFLTPGVRHILLQEKKSLPRTFFSARECWQNLCWTNQLCMVTDTQLGMSISYFTWQTGLLIWVPSGPHHAFILKTLMACSDACINLFQRWCKHCTMKVANKNFSKEWWTQSINQHKKE